MATVNWRVSGSYFEVCNCDAICPCRRRGGQLEHRPGRWFMRAGNYVTATAVASVNSELAISCGIPGHDHPGHEVLADLMRVDDEPLSWHVHGRCGFATDFDYSSGP
ncbi:MAG TPA: hypothetical protein VFP91_18580 [Vicinamibacterales bacterium]|nr:hypothetical protein [Vicinamibacterales bacterium]